MITTVELRRKAREAFANDDHHHCDILNDAADTIDMLCKQIDGCVRVAADALRRANDTK